MALFPRGRPIRKGVGAMAAVAAMALTPSGAALAANPCVADPMMVATRTSSPTMTNGRLAPVLVAQLDAAARTASA